MPHGLAARLALAFARGFALAFALAMAWGGAASAQARLRIPDAAAIEPGPLAAYYPALLRLALDRTAEPGQTTELQTVAGRALTRERYRRMLAAGELDLVWSTSTPAREAEFLPVRFNLLKGVNERRVLVIRRTDQARFAAVRDLEALRAFRAGAGEHWSDALILRANGLQVVTASHHAALFRMLNHGRFDFLALGLAEVDDALQAHPDLGLAVEPQLLLSYPQPIHFFVHRQRPELADRLLRGLQLAAADGSLDRLFMGTPALKAAWERLQGTRRHLLTLRAL